MAASRIVFTLAIFISSWARQRQERLRFRVLIDGQPPGAAHGTDVDEQGDGTVTEQRLYQLIRQPKPIADRQFEIEFLGPGMEVFAFTFG
jgi:Thioredoxin like C-terminal domain